MMNQLQGWYLQRQRTPELVVLLQNPSFKKEILCLADHDHKLVLYLCSTARTSGVSSLTKELALGASLILESENPLVGDTVSGATGDDGKLASSAMLLATSFESSCLYNSAALERNLPNKADVNAEAPMYGRAIDTQEDPISHRRPGWVLRIAIKTHLPKQEEIQTKKTFTDIINTNHSKTIDLGDRARSETDLHKLNTNSQGNTTNFALGFRTKLPENSILVAEILGSHGRCGERDRSSERRCKE
nr:hypothetical protein Iba_chr13bCG8730 [Ipomoea batatas]